MIIQKNLLLSAVVAMSENRVIGKQNRLPWRMPADMRHFKTLTTGHVILMGRKTYESIGKPLPNRTNLILTRDKHYQANGCIIVTSINDAIDIAQEKMNATEIFVIGGAEIYRELLPYLDRIYLTVIHQHIDGDTFFPEFDQKAWQAKKREDFKADDENPFDYSFIWLERMIDEN